MTEDLDRRFMAAAIRLGAGANGSTWPNPAVGAILVKDGAVIARGRTAQGGRPHGEAAALAIAGEAARGATLYVSLEPCAHRGRAGPCADAILAAGVSRVVAAVEDPDPRTAGEGFRRVGTAGIDLATGLMADAASHAHAGHFSRVREKRPYVLLKLAVSADGAIGRAGEGQVAVTGEIARRQVQALRTRFDAIMVGRGTVEADDPELTVRLPGLEDRSPIRVILDSDRRLSGREKIFSGSARTWVIGAAPSASRTGSGSGCAVPRGPNGLELCACLRLLAEEGVTRLLVEGGAKVARGLIEADLVDEIMLFRNPRVLGGAIVPALAGLPLSAVEASERFLRIERRPFGTDMMSRYARKR